MNALRVATAVVFVGGVAAAGVSACNATSGAPPVPNQSTPIAANVTSPPLSTSLDTEAGSTLRGDAGLESNHDADVDAGSHRQQVGDHIRFTCSYPTTRTASKKDYAFVQRHGHFLYDVKRPDLLDDTYTCLLIDGRHVCGAKQAPSTHPTQWDVPVGPDASPLSPIPWGGEMDCPDPAKETIGRDGEIPVITFPLCGTVMRDLSLTGDPRRDCDTLAKIEPTVFKVRKKSSEACELVAPVSSFERPDETGDRHFFCAHVRDSPMEARFDVTFSRSPYFEVTASTLKPNESVPSSMYQVMWTLTGAEKCSRGHPPHSVCGGVDEMLRDSPHSAEDRIQQWHQTMWKHLHNELVLLQHQCIDLSIDQQ